MIFSVLITFMFKSSLVSTNTDNNSDVFNSKLSPTKIGAQ